MIIKKLIKWIVIALAAAIFLYGFNLFLNLTYYNPSVIIPFYGWLDKYKLAEPAGKIIELGQEEAPYPLVAISRLQSNFFGRPRAAVIGIVADIQKVSDGDVHVNIKDPGSDHVLITEIVPEFPLPSPQIGQKIKIWGITRYDLEHRWWELHPVFGWEMIK